MIITGEFHNNFHQEVALIEKIFFFISGSPDEDFERLSLTGAQAGGRLANKIIYLNSIFSRIKT